VHFSAGARLSPGWGGDGRDDPPSPDTLFLLQGSRRSTLSSKSRRQFVAARISGSDDFL